MFTHVNLAQSRTWNQETLCPLTEFLAKLDICPIGLSFTQAGIRAVTQNTIIV